MNIFFSDVLSCKLGVRVKKKTSSTTITTKKLYLETPIGSAIIKIIATKNLVKPTCTL